MAGSSGSTRANGHKTAILTIAVVLSNVVGNLLLSRGMHQVGQIVSVSPLDYEPALMNPSTIIGVCVLVVWMVLDLALLSRADLSFVLPVTASAYVLIAIAGHFVLHERIDRVRWLGIIVISIGTALAGETPSRTTEGPPPDLL